MLHLKTSQNAVAVVSRLAELHAAGDAAASSAELAKARNLPQPLVAKILNTLARARLVKGAPGPGGGYRLARHPSQVSLFDVVILFEGFDDDACPYGPGWCGHGDPCPLHDSMIAMRQVTIDFLRNTTFGIFSTSNPPARGRTRRTSTNGGRKPKSAARISRR